MSSHAMYDGKMSLGNAELPKVTTETAKDLGRCDVGSYGKGNIPMMHCVKRDPPSFLELPIAISWSVALQ